MAMARVQLADLEKRTGWIHVVAKGVSYCITETLGGSPWVAFKGAGRRYSGGPVSKRWRRTGYNSLGNAVPEVRVREMHEGCKEDEAGGSGHILVN